MSRFETLKETVIRTLEPLLFSESPVIPQRPIHSEKEPFSVDRPRKALSQLHKRSLIICDGSKKSFSTHPIVHTWVRERPETMLQETNPSRPRSDMMGEIPEMCEIRKENGPTGVLVSGGSHNVSSCYPVVSSRRRTSS